MKAPRKRKRIIVAVSFVIITVITITITAYFMMPKRDTISTDSIPAECMLTGNSNYITYQSGNQCSAYASAYVMRYLGRETNGEELYPKIRRIFGFVPVSSITGLFKDYGYKAQSCYGDINTLKKQLSKGVPVIAFTSIGNDTHYVSVVGYDEEYVFIADSIKENANTRGGFYNRKLSIDEFEEIWKTDAYPMNNVYIVIS